MSRSRPIGSLTDLTRIDERYSCVMDPQPHIILKTEIREGTGKLVYAWVPWTNDSLKRMVVFVADNEPPVENFVIENFSTKHPCQSI